MVGNLGRVSTFGLNDSSLTNILQTQRNIAELSSQITSGKVARRYEGLAQNSNRLVTIENELERTLQYRQNSEDVERRLNEMESGLASIIEMGIELRADLVLASNPGNAENTPLASMGRAFYEQTAAFLNAEQDNRYLFGGSKTDRPPVNGLDEVTAAFRQAQTEGGALDYGNLAGKKTVITDNDENSSVPLRTLQIIDFFLNDSENGTVNTAYPLDSTDGYVGGATETAFRTNTQAISFKSLYYDGDQNNLSSKLEDNLDLEYGVSADQKGLEKVLLAGWLLSETDSPTPTDGPVRTTFGGFPGDQRNANSGAVDETNLTAYGVGGTNFTVDGVNIALPANATLEQVATLINGANVPNVTAEINAAAIPPTAISQSFAGVAGPVAAEGLTFQDLSGNAIFPAVALPGGQTLEQAAATIEAQALASGVELEASVRQSTSNASAWIEVSFADGREFNLFGDGAGAPGGFTGAFAPVIETIESIELTNSTGAQVALAVPAATPATGLIDNATTLGGANDVIDTEDRVEVALKLLEDALQDFGTDTLTAIRSEVGVDLNRVEDVQSRYNQFEIFHEEVQTEIENTDIATAATQLSQSQLILESSFLAISNVQQLSLANFLR